MACDSCKDKRIADGFKCSSCHIKEKTFLWCVITKADENDEGNQYDHIINNQLHTIKLPTFQKGEIFAIEPSFGREINGPMRKPSKWDVEYKTFSADEFQKALLLSVKLSNG